MRLVSFGPKQQERPGVIVGDAISPLDPIVDGPAIDGLIERWSDLAVEVARIAASEGPRIPLAGTRLGSPLLRPQKIIGVGANYRDASGVAPKGPIDPILFFKPASALVGQGDPVILPPEAGRVVAEVELVVVIGKAGHRIARDAAMDHVFGYTIANDVTAPEVMLGDSHESPLFFQQGRGKGFPTFCPLGPWVVTRDEIANPYALSLAQRVNDQVELAGNASLMQHDIAALVSESSHAFGLVPGDLILSGSPRPGRGTVRKPLQPGDMLHSAISGIGELANPILAEDGITHLPIRRFGDSRSAY